jgi:glycosyltransferase involved in cell wall biosynthesis
VLAYRGGLLASARRPLGFVMVPAYIVAMTHATVAQARRSKADVIHAHWWFPGGLAALVASRIVGVPFVVTLHGSDLALARRPALRWLARRVLGRASTVMAVSTPLATEAVTFLNVDVEVARMPVPVAGHRDALPPPDPPPPLRVVAAGRLTPEKGFDVLVAAVAQLAHEGVDVQLDLVGDGPDAARLRGPRVSLRGALPRTELHALMAGAHAVVVPSRREGLGLVAVEALALGRPVVASRVGGLTETVEDGVDGILVAPGDVRALAAALRCLPLAPPAARGVERHRPEAVALTHAEVYRRALKSSQIRRDRHGTGEKRA